MLVTGGAGFIGSHVVEALGSAGATVRVADSLTSGSIENLRSILPRIEWVEVNLLDPDGCVKACDGIEIVLNLAAKVAGVAYNSAHHADMFCTNVKIGMNMLEAARISDVERFLVVSSACVYSRDSTVPTPESEGFVNDPEPSNFGYGWGKRVLELQGRLYAQQYGMKTAIVRPFNTYGPRDHFDLEYGHVIPSLIKKVMDGDNPLVVWGDGKQTRSFVYVTDVVSGMIRAIEKYPVADPVNIGTEEEISIGDLTNLIVRLTRPTTDIVFDRSKPSGQQRRCPDLTKAKSSLGFEAGVRLSDGVEETIHWFRSRHSSAN